MSSQGKNQEKRARKEKSEVEEKDEDISEKPNLETELKEKSEEGEIENPEILNFEVSGVGFTKELVRILDFQASAKLENTETNSTLEKNVSFAPMIIEKHKLESKNYSSVKYDENMYNENKYSEKTPSIYSEKSNSSKSNNNLGSDTLRQ